jgi:D-galactose 1-dehydrogenase
MAELRIGIIGYGKIARDQHVPAIAADPAFRLCAVVAPGGTGDATVPVFADHRAMLAAVVLDAVAICTPAGPRYAIARDCLESGVDALLEKPPTTTLGEIEILDMVARTNQRVLFTAWHAQHNRPVERLRELLADERLGTMRIEWREDVEKWHPGQGWIWRPGGFGVFDAGINALSIATAVIPASLVVRSAAFTAHGDAGQPIAASLVFEAAGSPGPLTAELDWRHKGEERWTIEGTTSRGTPFLLSGGGSALRIGTGPTFATDEPEYRSIYRAFADLCASRRSLVDSAPLRLLADAFLIARR